MAVSPEELDPCPPLKVLPAGAKRALADVAHEVRFSKDERIVPLLKIPSRLVIVLEGLAKLVGVSQSGTERILYVFHPCDIIGSRVLLEETPEAPYEIVAMDQVRGLSISKAELLSAARDHPEILVAITQDFSRRLNNLTSRMLAAMSAEVPVRLSKLLFDFAETDNGSLDEFVPLSYPLTHEAMAQIIGASRPHTSTVLRDLEEFGAVQRRSERGLLVRPSRLARIVSEGSMEPMEEV